VSVGAGAGLYVMVRFETAPPMPVQSDAILSQLTPPPALFSLTTMPSFGVPLVQS
jgi:hypothetical protein